MQKRARRTEPVIYVRDFEKGGQMKMSLTLIQLIVVSYHPSQCWLWLLPFLAVTERHRFINDRKEKEEPPLQPVM